MAGGHAQGFLPVPHHTDVAAFDLFFDLDLHDTAFLQLFFTSSRGMKPTPRPCRMTGTMRSAVASSIPFQDQAVEA